MKTVDSENEKSIHEIDNVSQYYDRNGTTICFVVDLAKFRDVEKLKVVVKFKSPSKTVNHDGTTFDNVSIENIVSTFNTV